MRLNKWEQITSDPEFTFRMKVPGGWLVKVITGPCTAMSICFYPDPMHRWGVEQKEPENEAEKKSPFRDP